MYTCVFKFLENLMDHLNFSIFDQKFLILAYSLLMETSSKDAKTIWSVEYTLNIKLVDWFPFERNKFFIIYGYFYFKYLLNIIKNIKHEEIIFDVIKCIN